MTTFYTHNFGELLSRINEISKSWDGDFKNAAETIRDVAKSVKEHVDIPMNVIVEPDGANTIEIAVPGKTKEDIKLEGCREGTENVVYVRWVKPTAEETTEGEEKKDEAPKRFVAVQKIKIMEKDIRLTIPSNLDSSKLTASVRNGLLTIYFPVAEEVKPKEFAIEG